MTDADDRDVLLIGYGNPGRLDDGLGPAAAKAVEELRLPGVTVETDYQLTVEDAADVARCKVVVFVDADVGGPAPFRVRRIEPGPERVGFSSHSVAPREVLALAKQLFNAAPKGYILGIRGYEFDDFGEALSEKAQANLAEAVEYVKAAIRKGEFEEVCPDGRGWAATANPN